MRWLACLLVLCLPLAAQSRPIRLSVGEVSGVNPLLIYTEDQYLPIDLVFDRLVTMDAQGNFLPQILERWELSPDLKEARLEVRKGLQWQDGRPLDAQDILFTWRLIRTPRMRALADNQGTWIPDLEATGPHSLRIRSGTPLTTLLSELYNFFPVPRHAYPEVGDPLRHPFHLNPVGSGPYRVVPGARRERLVLQRWEGYRGPHPGVAPGFEFLQIGTLGAGAGPAPLGERLGRLGVDLLNGTSWFYNMLVRRGGPGLEPYVALHTVQDGFEAAWFNCDPRLSVMGDVRLRQAIANLLPWDEYARERQVRPVQVATSLWHPLSWASDPGAKALPKPALAAQLLDEAGWRLGPSGWRRNAQGQELVISLYITRPLSQDPFLRKYIAAINRAGVRVDAREADSQRMQEAQAAGRGDMWMGAWVNNGPDPNGDRLVYTSEGIANHSNYMRYANPEVDRLFELGRQEVDREARQEIYRRINRIIQRERPLVLLEYVPYYAIASRRLGGLGFSHRGTLYGFIPGMRGWRLE